jgi:putative ABC transport system permease protein
VQNTTANVFLTPADFAARQEAQDVQFAYVANQDGFRFGAFNIPGGPGGAPPDGGPPPGGQQGDTVFVAQGGSAGGGGGQVLAYSAGGAATAGDSTAGRAAGGNEASGGQQAAGQQAGGQQAGGQQQRQRQIVQPPPGPQPIMEEARGYEVTPEFFTAWGMTAAQGSLFALADVQKREPVIVLGSTIATTLFEDKQSMGRQVLSRNQLYRIIGILEPTGTDYDTMIFTPAPMPDLTGMDVFARFRGFNTNLHFTVADYTKLERAKAQLESYFDRKFGTGSAVITVPRYQAEAAKDRNTRLVTVILFLALAALVIAAANVTNILFSRALRKRRSVGILKALGATRRGVFQLFFLEALLIGIAGAAVGAGLSVLMSKLMQDTMGYGAVYVSLLAAGIIGAAALVTALDIFPAMQAARVPAAEAIRYE